MVNIVSIILFSFQLGNPALAKALPNALIGFFERTEEIRETHKVKPGTELTVVNVNGDIMLTAWDKDYVEVHAVKKTHHGDEELAKVQVEITVADKIEIRTKHLERNARVSVEYDIRVPDNVIVKHLLTSNGDIELGGTTGDTEAVTSNGNIELKKVVGTVQVRTSNGDIAIRDTRFVREATTSNGEVRAEIQNVPEGGAEIATSNGSVDLYINDQLNVDLNIATSMGRVTVKDLALKSRFTARTETSTVLKGKLGEGGELIDTHTANGDIRLYKLGK